MADINIVCPNCAHQFPLSEVVERTLRGQMKQELEANLDVERKKLSDQKSGLDKERLALDELVQSKLKLERDNLANEYAKKFADAKKEALKTAKSDAEQAFSSEKEELQAEVERKSEALKKAQEKEQEVRKERQDLKQQLATLETELLRKLDDERQLIEEKAKVAAKSAYEMKLEMSAAENARLRDQLGEKIKELERIQERGSQEQQGELREIVIEKMLKAAFPGDRFEPVPKGKLGADCLQHVCGPRQSECGIIVWESKDTLHWNDEWIPKVKSDVLRVGGHVAIVVSVALPKGVGSFENRDGVWITGFPFAIALAAVLRSSLIELADARKAAEGQQTKMEHVYNYLTGPLFKQRVEQVVNAFKKMGENLEAEKTAMNKLWATRRKQLDLAMVNMVGMHGDLQGIAGSSLPELGMLDLTAISEDARANSEEK
jgi:hypothetical protein